MPTYSGNWHAKTFQDAAWWRAEAEKWGKLAAAAERDGDTGHAEHAKREAANCRENARLKEIGDDD